MYASLDSGATRNVTSTALPIKLKLNPIPSNRRIIAADGSSGSCHGVVSEIPIRFGDIMNRLDFMIVDSVACDLIIGAPTLVKLCTRMDLYHQPVNLPHNGLNLEYELEIDNNTGKSVTSESDSENDFE